MSLNNLLKKNQNWNWTPECQQSFQKLKDSLISKPILAIFNPNYPCHLYVDASKTTISCILKQQNPNGNQHLIAFHSRRLRNYEINYTITGFPPTYLMYGNLPFEISLKDNEIYPPLEEARKLAKERTEQYYKINKIRYDKKFQEADFKVGDLVMYEEFQYPNTRKLSPPYSGPYTVLRKCSDVLFKIDRPNALNKTDTELVHSVRLRHFHPSENFQLNYIQQNTHIIMRRR
ncbi:transposon Ty3-G Gag-Pol polyprotein [Trichonephila clavipes]|nr:transposon Ty3-G Gag-Pol polyprotein [Trichonephila clavipes]